MENNSNAIINILKGSAISIIATLIFLCIFAILLTYTNLNENTLPTVVIVITVLSILIGSQLATGKIKRNGIINGAMVGVLYILTIYLLSSIVTKNFSLSKYSTVMIVASCLVGGIGGIIGVNKK